MPIRPQSAKSKGRRLQKAVAESILRHFPHLKEDDCFSTSMGAPGEDIRLSPRGRESVPLSIECKCQEKLNVWESLNQAARNCPEEATPCLVFSRNRSPTYAVVEWDFLIRLLSGREGSTSEATLKNLRRLGKEMSDLVGEESERPKSEEEEE